MSVSAADFHEFARRVLKVASSEIDHRCAVSRLYYAAYHASRGRLEQPGSPISPVRGHSEFCNQLMREQDRSELRRLGVALNLLRQQRNAADYALQREFGASESSTAIGAYGNAIRLLELALPLGPVFRG
jgi:uncharacterized protein (UPF0332 family)